MNEPILEQVEGAQALQELVPADLGGCHHLCSPSRTSLEGEMHLCQLWDSGDRSQPDSSLPATLCSPDGCVPTSLVPTVPAVALDPGRGCSQVWES